MLKLNNLLKKGYFPKELPPPFSTSEYSHALSGTPQPRAEFASKPWFSLSCIHNLVRFGKLRRNLAIPNPKHFFNLAKYIADNWKLFNHLSSLSPFSLSKPNLLRVERAITSKFYPSESTELYAELRSIHRILLKTDIARFYPSIYTHSIPWAIMGKEAAKQAHANGTLRGTWQDYTDKLLRSINNNQTIGIPIGPDISLVIAEILLSHIDVKLIEKYPELKGIRYIDDYEFAFSTRSEAEDVLSYFQHLLNEFELALNAYKTTIIELPYPFDETYISKIRTFVFRDAGITGQKNDLTAYFDMVFNFLIKNPEESMLKYAIARLRSIDIHQDNWELFESILCQCILIEPACIPQVCDQITHYNLNLSYTVKKQKWSNCLNTIVFERVPLGHSSEAAWAMWLMKLLNIELSDKSAKAIGSTEDSIVGLMALGLASVGMAHVNELSELNRFSSQSQLFQRQWLICYQGNLTKLLGSDSCPSNLDFDPAFSYLASKDVSFFDINVSPPVAKRYPKVYKGGIAVTEILF